MHCTVEEHGIWGQNNRSYNVNMTKNGHIITRAASTSDTNIHRELHNVITKAKYQAQHDDDFDELVYAYMLAYANASHTEAHTERHKFDYAPKQELRTNLKNWNTIHIMIRAVHVRLGNVTWKTKEKPCQEDQLKTG